MKARTVSSDTSAPLRSRAPLIGRDRRTRSAMISAAENDGGRQHEHAFKDATTADGIWGVEQVDCVKRLAVTAEAPSGAGVIGRAGVAAVGGHRKREH